jgi:hypothetical protein
MYTTSCVHNFSVRRVVHITYEKNVEERKKKKTVVVGSTGRSLGATGCRIGFAGKWWCGSSNLAIEVLPLLVTVLDPIQEVARATNDGH